MSSKQIKALSVTPPVAGKVLARTTVTTAEDILIPEAWRDGYVTFQAETSDVYLAFGDSTVVADPTDRSTLTADEITAYAGGECAHIPAGTSLAVDLSNLGKDITHFSHISADTSGVLRAYPSSGQVS